MDKLLTKLKSDVEALALPQGRTIGSVGHAQSRRYLCERMRALGLTPFHTAGFDVPYTVDGQDFHNLIGVVPGTDRDSKPVLIGAHYDSVIPAPCADDNAAAVAIALSAAEILARRQRGRDVIIAIFDAEEPWHFLTPSMGSIRFYQDHLASAGVHAALIMDLVGHDVVVPREYIGQLPGGKLLAWLLPKVGTEDVAVPGVRDLFFMTGAESHPEMAEIVESVRVPRRLRLIATLNSYVGDMSDHAVFRENNVPYLFLSCGRWRHYHMESDTPDKLNYRKMARLTHYLVTLAESVAAANQLGETAQHPADTAPFEIRTLERASGLAYPWVLRALGVARPQTRSDLDAIASRLLRMGL